MTTATDSRKQLISAGPGLFPVVVVGGWLGYVLAGDVFLVPANHLLLSLCLGLIWSYLLLQWLSLIIEFFSLFCDPVPLSLELANRAAVKEHLAKLGGRQPFTLRARSLLEAWVMGWSPRAVIALDAAQSRRSRRPMMEGTIFVLLLAFVSYALNGNLWLTWSALVVLALAVLARLGMGSRIDSYLEARLLTRLPANVPGTSMTAAELADALGGSITKAFQNYVPQPEKMAIAIQGAVENAAKTVASEVAKLDKVLGEHAEKSQAAAQAVAGQLAKIQELEKDIQKILHIQEVVDGTIKSVSAAEEFKQMLVALRTHLQESDKVLREAAKPKTIRLVENEQ
jgi:hypothetical protein